MPMSLNFNVAAVNAHRALIRTDRDLTDVLFRLSSGERLQRAADNPADMIQAQGLRYSLSGLEQAVSNAETGINLLNTAEGAMDEMSSRLRELRELAVNAANEGANSPEMLRALQTEADEIIISLDRFANETRFGTMTLLDGSLADHELSATARETFRSFRSDASQLPGGIAAGSVITLGAATADVTKERFVVTLDNGGAQPPAITDAISGLDQNGTTLTIAGGETVTVSGPGGSSSITLQPTTTIEQFVGLVNAQSGTTNVQASYDENTGALTVEGLGFGNAGVTIVSDDLSGGNIGLLDSDTTGAVNTFHQPATNPTIDVMYTDAQNVPQTVTMSQDPTQENGRVFTTIDGSFSLIVRASDDPGLNGVIELPDDPVTAVRQSSFFFQTGGESTQRTRFEIADLRPGALGQNVSSALTLASIQDIRDQQTLLDGNPQEALAVIDAAIEEVLVQRGRVGALQEHSLQANLTSLRVEIENISAAESRIRDIDFAEESAEYARLNIMYQAATSMLAQANQVPQSVLSLLS